MSTVLHKMALAAVQVGVGWLGEDSDSVNRYFYELLESLNDLGVDSRGLVAGSNAVDMETDGAIRSYSTNDQSVFRRRKNLRLAVRRAFATFPVDRDRILVTHHPSHSYALSKEWGDSPWIMHCHKPWTVCEGGGGLLGLFRSRLERQAYRRADAIVVTSKAYRDWLSEAYGIANTRIEVVNGGVDCDRFSPAMVLDRIAARKQLGWPIDRRIVLCVRRLEENSGLETLISSIRALRGQCPDVLCMIVGRGPLAGKLVEKIDAAGLSETVVLTGAVPDEDLPVAYRAGDLSVVPAMSPEEFSSNAVESLASGTPCVVTPIGGLPEIAEGLDPRLVAQKATAESLASAIAPLLISKNAVPNHEACRTYALENFDWSVVAPQILGVYERGFHSAVERTRHLRRV